jgi:hypothetical protein
VFLKSQDAKIRERYISERLTSLKKDLLERIPQLQVEFEISGLPLPMIGWMNILQESPSVCLVVQYSYEQSKWGVSKEPLGGFIPFETNSDEILPTQKTVLTRVLELLRNPDLKTIE